MPSLRENNSVVILRAEDVFDESTTEPHEVGWALEALVFVRKIEGGGDVKFSIQISADGMHWLDEGTRLDLPVGTKENFVKLTQFGNWIRLHAHRVENIPLRVTATLHLKG